MEDIRTGYDWCLEANIRILDIADWVTDNQDFYYCEDAYYKEEIDKETFLERLKGCKVKPNSQPRKTTLYLRYRMYGLVPYNISPIQQAIQYGHAVVEYGQKVKDDEFNVAVDGDITLLDVYNKWADNDKVFIILNGGTTNTHPDREGTLNKHNMTLRLNEIPTATFYEEDLGHQLTAVAFLVDERVFDKILYPDFVPETIPWSRKQPSEKQLDELAARNDTNYKAWVEKIGGEKNAFLREFVKPFRLA